MAVQNAYLASTLAGLRQRYAAEPEFVQAVTEFLESIEPALDANPQYEQHDVLSHLIEPERILMFKVTWTDDAGKTHLNHAYRIQYNSSLGPCKGGLRFHPSVNLSILKFLGFEMVFKSALTGLPLGGSKGGSDFDPKGKSDAEIMRFCQALMTELHHIIGPDVDVPAGDIGVGSREIGWLFGQYKKLTHRWDGVITGKQAGAGGSLARTEATGYGLCYFAAAQLRDSGLSFEGKRVVVSGSGNVALYTCQKCTQLGGKVVAMSDSDGYIFDPNGIDFSVLQKVKEERHQRISHYPDHVPTAQYAAGCHGIWSVPCDYAMPCATQNEIDADAARSLIANGCKAVFEGSNMSSTPEAVALIKGSGLLYSPSKASNAGGVIVSGFEMCQNSARRYWTFDEVDALLRGQMETIYRECGDAAARYGHPGDIQMGANLVSFQRVADAMLWLGC